MEDLNFHKRIYLVPNRSSSPRVRHILKRNSKRRNRITPVAQGVENHPEILIDIVGHLHYIVNLGGGIA